MRALISAIVLCVGCWGATGVLGGEFQFVVIGDTRPKFESDNFREFENLIPKINKLQPALVINLGDLIYGYGPRSKEKQWDRYQQTIKAIEVPYYQLPGNHDTHSREARRIYGRRFGKFYYSFDHGDCHFVLLDNTEAEKWGYLGPTQFEWLKADLAQTKASSVFVFMHFPVWEPERVTPRYYNFWLEKMQPLFKESRVRAVFGGHFHSYGPTREFDGIPYYITGGGGAELVPEYRKSGGEHHFLKIKAGGGQFDLRVVTERGESTDAEADIMGGVLFADKHSTRVGINAAELDLKAGIQFSVSLENPYTDFLSGRAEWTLDASAFAVEPRTISVGIPAHGTHTYSFTLKALKDVLLLQSSPRLEFNCVAAGHRHRFHRDIHFLQQTASPYTRAAPVLDGWLADWDPLPPIQLGSGLGSGAAVRTFHNNEHLFLAVTVPSIAASEKEESAFPDDLQVGLARRMNETDFGRDFLRLGFSASNPAARNRTPGSKPLAIVPGVYTAAHNEGHFTNFEIAIPFRFLRRIGTRGHQALILNVSYPLPDREEQDPNPGVNTFAYQVRYGTDSLVPVYFIEVDIEPRR